MFGGPKGWADRNVKPKPCRICSNIFQPSCGGNLYCSDCNNEHKRKSHAKAARIWRSKNAARHAFNKASYDLKQYGLTVDDYFNMLSKQGGKCQICGTDDPKGRGKMRPFAVDHCHKTGKVRALLCHRCNGALGMVSDQQEILEKMINYLKEHSYE